MRLKKRWNEYESAEEALEELFDYYEKEYYGYTGPLIWTCCMGIDKQKYGSYKNVTRDILKGREYRVEWSDYAPGIYFTDAVHIPKGSKTVLKLTGQIVDKWLKVKEWRPDINRPCLKMWSDE